MRRFKSLRVLVVLNLVVMTVLGIKYGISLKQKKDLEQKRIVEHRSMMSSFNQGEDLNRMTSISMQFDTGADISQSNLDWAVARLKIRETGTVANLRRMELLAMMGKKLPTMTNEQKEQVLSAALDTMKHQDASDEVGGDLNGCLCIFANMKDPKVIPYVKEIANDPRPRVKAQAAEILKWYQNGMKKK